MAPLLVQNKVKSSIGRGWHLGLTQTILSPNSNKILLEEESGDLSTYAINDTITTIFNSTNTGVDTDFAFDYSRWPKVVGVSKDSAKDNYLVEVDLSLPNPTPVRLVKIPQLEGGIPVNAFESGECNDNESFEVANRFYTYKTQTHLSGLVRNSNGEYYGLTSLGNSLFSLKNGIFSNLYLSSRPTNSIVQNFNRLSESQIENECLRYSGETCTKYTLSSYNCFIDCPSGSCPGLYPKDLSYGALGIYGGISDLYGSHNGFEMPLNEAGFNKASSLTTSPDGYLIVADTGNNMVRKIDVVNNLVHTIAGDGSNLDMADGVPATEAKIFHPKSVAYDNDGNLYILTQNGYIRKVNSTGMISHFGGVPPAQGGAQFEAPFKQMPLYQPSSMVFDKVNQYLYVADTGNHRVVRLDLNTEIASTVAGTGACDIGQVADNTAALNSSLCSPKNIGLDSQQNLIVVDSGHNRIRKVNFNYANTGTLAFTPTSKDGSVLYRYNDNSWSRVLRNGTTIYFNTIGAQTKTRDRLGNQVVYSYNSEGKLEKVTDAVGQVTSLNYSGSLLSSIVDPAGRTTGFSYSFGNLTSITFPDGSSKSYEYDGNGLMKKEINQRGFSKKYTYNEFSRLATVTDEFDKSVQINDVVSGSMSNSYTGENAGTLNNQGASQTQLHDRVVDAKEVSTEITKDFNGLVLKLKDGKGQITSIERDLEGYTKKVIFPDSSEVTLEYDELTKDLLKTTDTGTGITESQTFNRFGQLISKTDPKGFTYVKEYDPTTGLLVKETAPNLQNLIYTYNSSGLLASVTKTPASGISITTNIEYDSLGNRSKMILPDGKSVSYAYDGSGNLIQKTMQISSNSQEITKYQFDVLNRLRKVTSPKNEITEYNYLPTGQLSNIKDPLNNETIFEYNQKGLLTKKIEPDNKTYTFSYDFNGNLVSETDPNGITKVYSIDEHNQISKITLPDDEYNFVYSAKGEVIVVSNNAASITQSYDTKSRVVASVVQASSSLGSYPVVPLSYSYDKNGNRETLRSTALNLDYVYDQSNRLRQITNSNGDYFNFYIDNANRITKISRPGSETNFSYNAGDLLSSIVHSNSNGVVDSNGYSFDQRNLTTQKRTIAGNFDYSYDSSGQLTSANSPELGENFTYDDIGNRLTDQLGSYSYNPSRRLVEQDHSFIYTHDNNGNMIGKFSKAPGGDKINFLYTSLNQIKEIRIYSSTDTLKKTAKYYYDPSGRRILKSVVDNIDSTKSFSRAYVYDRENIIAEYDAAGNKLASYTHSLNNTDDILASEVTSSGQAAGLAQSAGRYHYLKDHLGSVDAIVDSSGNLVQKYHYSAFGKILKVTDNQLNDISASQKVNTSFTYTGREYDQESGLYFYRARSYDASLGRFMQKDPDAGRLMNSQSVNNKFNYASNNPISYSDPTGRASVFGWLAAVAFPFQSLIAMNTSSFFQDNFGFSSSDIKAFNSATLAVAIIAASIFTGGAAASAAGLTGMGWGAAVGAGVGAATGGVIGSIGFPALGLGSSQDGFAFGAALGAVGGAAGGFGLAHIGDYARLQFELARTDTLRYFFSRSYDKSPLFSSSLGGGFAGPSLGGTGVLFSLTQVIGEPKTPGN